MTSHQLDLMIVGAQKSGTSSLLAYLGQARGFSRHTDSEIDVFATTAPDPQVRELIATQYADAAATDVLVAKHATLMYHGDGLDRLLDLFPGVAFSVVLRHPVDRAYSSYWYRRGRGLEDEQTFEAALAADESRPHDYRTPGGRVGYVSHGLYAHYLRPLVQRVGRERVDIAIFEELVSDPGVIAGRIAQQLGADATAFADAEPERRNTAGRARSAQLARWINADSRSKSALKRVLPSGLRSCLGRRLRRSNRATFSPPPMAAATRVRLMETFAPDLRDLADELGVPQARTWSTG